MSGKIQGYAMRLSLMNTLRRMSQKNLECPFRRVPHSLLNAVTTEIMGFVHAANPNRGLTDIKTDALIVKYGESRVLKQLTDGKRIMVAKYRNDAAARLHTGEYVVQLADDMFWWTVISKPIITCQYA